MENHENLPTRSKNLAESIPSTGLSVVYEPDRHRPVADIILVHGLKGHPYKTWRFNQASKPEHAEKGAQRPQQEGWKSKPPKRLRQSFKAWVRGSPSKDRHGNELDESTTKSAPNFADTDLSVFWPVDLLSKDCKKARILTFGYDTKVTKYTSGPTNMNSIFSHGKDFLFALGRDRVPDRPLIFIAHSLGGILVKEMLALSSTSDTVSLQGIVMSTAAIIFMGTPHRGSPEFSEIGELARSMLSTFGIQTSSAILDTLGLKTTDLERIQEAFSRLWNQYDFKVKTFQEGFGFTGINLGVIGNKVVPHDSSLIGDPREHAETLQANHMEMCRFTSARDPNYVKVAGEIRGIYTAIENSQTQHPHRLQLELPEGTDLKLLDFVIGSLRFGSMNSRQESILPPAENTGQWLFQHSTYNAWRSTNEKSQRLLFIKGKPGAGKSTLMKGAIRNMQSHYNGVRVCASFFINARGRHLEHSPSGVFRSLLCQLLPHSGIPSQSRDLIRNIRDDAALCLKEWHRQELQALLTEILEFLSSKHIPVFIFVDALDELKEATQRRQVEFWRGLVHSSNCYTLRVCLSCRHFPNISITGCLDIILDIHNSSDIFSYINQRLEARISDKEAHWRTELALKVFSLSEGVFLWVVLVVDNILAKYDRGASLRELGRLIEGMPADLIDLYTQLISSLEENERPVAAKIFQWAMEATRPLRLDEWHHILAFIKSPPPKSLRDWQESDTFTENDEQLEREIKALSRGLLEVSNAKTDALARKVIGTSSINAGAGSLDHEQGSARVIQFIHQSVHGFFKHHQGFQILGWSGRNLFADCHCALALTCLDYLNIPELDDLIVARQRVTTGDSAPPESVYSSPLGQFEDFDTQRTNTLSKHTMEVLQALPMINPSHLVKSWLAEGDLISYPNSDTEANINPIFADSAGIASQALQDYPALLPYLATELHFHIEFAKRQGWSMLRTALLDKLENKTTWSRFVALKEEDSHKGTGPIENLICPAGRGASFQNTRLVNFPGIPTRKEKVNLDFPIKDRPGKII
ncbi:hypothetical protein FOMG_17424 [Fusarium oxysporum f. sp. melonis 26406]|uniref:Nephrocystin 3-like N-terminal domain-containing protein n=1 Tax=Fusarium oxysporum f. sp. melonis 26406 TaxID=1089452 RepID=W9ZCI5_FUSOX|nr:hypothetical protein FOMG_17424 [Fusarium oxysporum f. sp. melonis 26406]